MMEESNEFRPVAERKRFRFQRTDCSDPSEYSTIQRRHQDNDSSEGDSFIESTGEWIRVTSKKAVSSTAETIDQIVVPYFSQVVLQACAEVNSVPSAREVRVPRARPHSLDIISEKYKQYSTESDALTADFSLPEDLSHPSYISSSPLYSDLYMDQPEDTGTHCCETPPGSGSVLNQIDMIVSGVTNQLSQDLSELKRSFEESFANVKSLFAECYVNNNDELSEINVSQFSSS